MEGQSHTYRDVLAREGQGQMQGDPSRMAATDFVMAYPPLSHRVRKEGPINPYFPTPGETLLEGLGRNDHGLLMRHVTLAPELDMNVIQREASFLQEHTIVASFLGKKIPLNAYADWIQSINRKLGYDVVSYKLDMGRGFIFLSYLPLMCKLVGRW
ncbi:hypothetical protein M758_UG126500 [Ceratodon purpureus]|nr:hypothetical protein M758_UG126500 [Ceratodon purpureus]